MGPPTAIEHVPPGKDKGGESITEKNIWTAQGNPYMRKEHLTADSFSRDILDFLLLLHKQDVRYLIVGGEAVIFHGYTDTNMLKIITLYEPDLRQWDEYRKRR